MKRQSLFLLGALVLLSYGCNKNDDENPVVSQRYIHKYGYAVSKQEWEEKKYPGQIITSLRSGVTLTATYEDGILHGPCTHTHPHSQTVEYYYLYNQGALVKEIVYDALGMPIRERVQLSPTRYSLTSWYKDGTPMSVEDYASEELVEGEYFSTSNELEARIEKGNGSRIRRDRAGILLSKDDFEGGYMVKRDTFYASGAPESTTPYLLNQLHGERRAFAESGEPLSIEEWWHGQLHGKSTYFKNGSKEREIFFLNGARNGVEQQYVDGEQVSREIHWENDKRHGPSIFFVSGIAQTEWYYNGQSVSKSHYDELYKLDQMISQISNDVRIGDTR